ARAAGGWAERLAESNDWAELAPALAAHYREHGAGPLARYRALRWNGEALEPVLHPDIPSPAALVGYEAERALLRRTTAQFAAGHPGNSVLLYGDRGTGKSSSVKSLLHAESADGPGWERLRLIEVPKARLVDFPTIVPRLRGRPQRFILFVDDLSFEDGETEYKHMKAMLEGGIEARPENVVVYATSNRRHLIRERFTDRTSPDSDDVHARDTVEEKLSFSDRFGVTITFPSPSQAAYLEIVAGLAAQRGIPLEPAALRARAIEWAAWHNGRSGRTARQFVDYLEGELGLGTDLAASRA
ncbi:MAG TPA: ATP-binding protein, partial [Chloroflexota bacterium]|nr:ATP-binding protein [Chloroflexota bacterium]